MGKLTTMRTARQMRDEGHPASRVLLVGESNPYGGPDANALVCWPAGCAGHRLQSKILGVDEETYLAMHRRNLCRGSWLIRDARLAAAELRAYDVWPWTTVILLGRKVAEAWSFYHDFFEVEHDGEREQVTVVSLPHPSGRVTLWNDAARGAHARYLLAQAAPGVPWGSLGRDVTYEEGRVTE